jgi:hypothetical protein
MMITNVDDFKDDFTARLHHHLKQRLNPKSTLDPKVLENVVCDALGITNIGDQELFADGHGNNYQITIKTIKSKSNGTDNFQDNAAKHLGPFNVSDENIIKNGPEIVWRRQRVQNEQDDPNVVGQYCLDELYKKCQESKNKLGVEKSISLYLVHALDKDEQLYRISLYWEENKPYDQEYFWTREYIQKRNSDDSLQTTPDSKIRAYKNHNGNRVLKWIRIDGNVSRYATCLIELKNFLEFPADNQLHLTIVLPEIIEYDKEKCLTEQVSLQDMYYREERERAKIMSEFLQFQSIMEATE